MLAEWEEIFGHYYGTLKSELENALVDSKICLLDVDVKGALNIKKLYPDNTLTIFLLPPNQEELERRLMSRGTEKKESILKRKERLPEELKLAEQFDYIIVNDKLDETVDKIKRIIKDRMTK
jgi:guanylate kinase